ncbi:hypothetical protein [Abyssibacter sp.]|uniref:hypothetical protein n=1 Tax=Abyssibacter sp. TaxID=2320200 RepID=UPI0025C46AB7|nr:hypothetical protein [Abyssibacter sp.]MCK5860828.1 hypothetical protein [Abyssibacter sp.]
MLTIKTSRWALFASCLALLSTGCSLHRPVLQPDTRASIDSTDVTLIIEQEEIIATFRSANSSAAMMQFGLIGAVIGASLDAAGDKKSAARAESRVTQVRNALLGFEFDAMMEAALDRSLAGSGWINATRPALVTTTQASDDLDARLKAGTSDTHLFTNVRYLINDQLSSVTVELQAMLLPQSPAFQTVSGKQLAGPPYAQQSNALYGNTIRHSAYFDDIGFEARKAAWVADDGALLKTALIAGIEEVTTVLLADLQNPKKDINRKAKLQFSDPTREIPPTVIARELREIGDATRVRWSNGHLSTFIPAHALAQQAAAQTD